MMTPPLAPQPPWPVQGTRHGRPAAGSASTSLGIRPERGEAESRGSASTRLARALPIVMWLSLSLGPAGAPVGAETSSSAGTTTVVKKKDGLRFNVPSDWPVEERNGAVGPIPIEEYLAKKFSSIENRLRLLEQQVSSFDLRLRVLEEDAKKSSRGGLRSVEQTKP